MKNLKPTPNPFCLEASEVGGLMPGLCLEASEAGGLMPGLCLERPSWFPWALGSGSALPLISPLEVGACLLSPGRRRMGSDALFSTSLTVGTALSQKLQPSIPAGHWKPPRSHQGRKKRKGEGRREGRVSRVSYWDKQGISEHRMKGCFKRPEDTSPHTRNVAKRSSESSER